MCEALVFLAIIFLAFVGLLEIARLDPFREKPRGVDNVDYQVATNLLAAFETGDLKPDSHGYVRVKDMVEHANLAKITDPMTLGALMARWEIPKGPARRGYHAEKLHSLLADTMPDQRAHPHGEVA